MELSLIFAKIWGMFLIVNCLAILFNRESFKKPLIDFGDRSLVYVSGLLLLIGGIVNIVLHDIWVCDWRLSVTILGWIAFVKGIAMVTRPDLAAKYIVDAKKSDWYIVPLAFFLILGSWLLYIGFGY